MKKQIQNHPYQLVSIVLPVYNGEQYLRGAIDSCLNQTYGNIELIIVDDSSTDSTPDIITSFTDDRITYIRHDKNKMLPGALNTGFRNSKGGYLTWTSDDNEYFPNAIEEMVNCLKAHGDKGLVYADYWIQNEMTGEKSLRKLSKPLHLETYNGLGACFLYTRNVYEAVGEYSTSLGLVEDYDYWIRIAKRFETHHISTPLYLYREHGTSLTQTKLTKVVVLDRILKYKHGFIDDTELLQAFDKYIDAVSENRSSVKEALGNIRAISKVLKRNLPYQVINFNSRFVTKGMKFLIKKAFSFAGNRKTEL